MESIGHHARNVTAKVWSESAVWHLQFRKWNIMGMNGITSRPIFKSDENSSASQSPWDQLGPSMES